VGELMKKPLLPLLLSVVLLLAACGSNTGGGSLFKEGIAEFINNEYVIHDTVSSVSNSSNFSEIYIAENQSIEEVSSTISGHIEPVEKSEIKDDKQVLVYDQLFVILTKDEENTANTYIEVANDEFVKNNYSPSFFNGLLLFWVLDDLLDVDDWGKKQNLKCRKNPNYCYGGYGASGGSFKGLNQTPTIRKGSSVRGGGPGSGK
jgi:Domain of unknown function (DUF4247)